MRGPAGADGYSWMLHMRQAGSLRRTFGLTACLGVLALGLASPATAQEDHPLPAPVAVADDDLAEALDTGELTEAEYALERARSVFQLGRVRREFGDVERPGPHDVTLILRDLALRLDELSGADRRTARSILARPPQGGLPDVGSDGWTKPEAALSPECGEHVCIHWVDPVDVDAPPPLDAPPKDGIPDWVETVKLEWEHIWDVEIDELGYRPPLPDGTSSDPGPSDKLDVYLEDLGSVDVFGYCTSDDPAGDDPDVWVVSAYCVIDNDFAEFGPSHTPEEFMQVTSAHEFHHASQFAYDWAEDWWMMEGTAVNMEETVYPDVDDNVVFLRYWSPLTRPWSPLDRGGFGDSEYGSWIFWRFLEEKAVDHDPGILREIWERAANVYSLKAVTKELTQRGRPFRDVFAEFATANRLSDYDDAAEAGYPVPPRSGVFGLGPKNRVIGWRTWKINHLAARFLSFTAGSKASASAKLRLEFKLPKYGTRATVMVIKQNGERTVPRRLNQNKKGFVRWGAPFGKGKVKRVEVALTNGSTRIKPCWVDFWEPYTSCHGRPLDDGRAFRVRATMIG